MTTHFSDVKPLKNSAAFDEFRDAVLADLAPSGAIEQLLVAEIIHAGWQLGGQLRCSPTEASRARADALRIVRDALAELRRIRAKRPSAEPLKSNVICIGTKRRAGRTLPPAA
ncbi:MAG: hypothetical protein M3N93_13545 [Acidobacteriota bacterium]|nr:hypothetical protein [Acidobacteriota bacterium]